MGINKRIWTFYVIVMSTIIMGCEGDKMVEKTPPLKVIKEIPSSKWEKLAKKKIYFGHQSVGKNIIDGIKDLMKEYPEINLNIKKTNNYAEFNKSLFAHSSIGKNDAPLSKIEAFEDYMKKGIGDNVDFAFFKFCFADIIGTTDVNAVFNDYKKTMSDLKENFPEIAFIHITIPLVITKKTLRAKINRLLGKKDIWFYDGNIKRNELNKLIIDEYSGREPVFDLAKIESTKPDGTRETFTEDGKIHYAMVHEYTKDAGHLNELGRKKAAQSLLILLANLN